jgi:hypothetical protein
VRKWGSKLSLWVVVYVVLWVVAADDNEWARVWYHCHRCCYRIAKWVGRAGLWGEARYWQCVGYGGVGSGASGSAAGDDG